MDDFERMTPKEAKLLALKNKDYLMPCPCCRRWVVTCEARSIFNFNIKICPQCALNEKALPNFDWTQDLKEDDVLLEE